MTDNRVATEDTNSEDVIQVVINPLSFIKVEHKRPDDEDPTAEDVIRYLCEEVNATPANLVRRYRELTKQSPRFAVIPAQREIVEKMLVPLHGAITSYMIGSYHGTIALCGLVCEMLAIFLYEIHGIQINSKAPDEKAQGKLFGKSFEKLGQERRVDVLSGFGVINDDHKTKFDAVRDIRRRHLHFLSHDTTALIVDAQRCFQCTTDLFGTVFRNEFRDGKVLLRPQVVNYIKRRTAAPAKTKDDTPPDGSP